MRNFHDQSVATKPRRVITLAINVPPLSARSCICPLEGKHDVGELTKIVLDDEDGTRGKR